MNGGDVQIPLIKLIPDNAPADTVYALESSEPFQNIANPEHNAFSESPKIAANAESMAKVQPIIITPTQQPSSRWTSQIPWFIASVIAGLIISNLFKRRGKK